MPERKHDSRTMLRQMHRLQVKINLGFDQILNHFGIPPVTDEEVDKVLAAEGITPPVKSPANRDGHLSTDDPSIHRRPHGNPPSRKEVRR